MWLCGLRVVIDERQLNAVTQHVEVHLPSCDNIMNDLLQSLRGFGNDAKVDAKPNWISSTDFNKGFHSMR